MALTLRSGWRAPGYLVANAVLYAVVEAKRNGEDKVDTETLLARAIENVAADEPSPSTA